MAVNKRRYLATNKVSCSCSMPGVWKAVAHNDGSAVIYHAPKACAHITGEMERNRHFRTMVRGEFSHFNYTAPLITSGIEKKESIFGGSELLRDCIFYVAKTYSPRYIVVASSCVAGVIGDDTNAVCEVAEARLGIPILHVSCYGFLDGEYYGGYIEAGKCLVDRFMKKGERIPNTVTVIGEKDGPQSLAMRDFSLLLKEFGITVYKQFPGYCSVEEMEIIGRSSFTVILGGSRKAYARLKELADYMTARLGIPHFEADYPIGWKATCRWLEKIGAFLGQEEKANEAKRFLWKELQKSYEPYKVALQNSDFVLCLGKSERDMSIDWVLEWLMLGGLSLHRVLLLESFPEQECSRIIEKIKNSFPQVIVERESKETKLQSEKIVITTHELADPLLRQLLLPLLPPIGTAGLVQMYKKLFMLARRSSERGIVFYGW